MDDGSERKMEEAGAKGLETTQDKHEESTVFREMLFEVGENLTSQHVDTLAELAEFSVREKDEIRHYTGNKPLYLFQLLERKGKVSQSDVLWLHSNLIKIHNKMAANIVSNYISGPDHSAFRGFHNLTMAGRTHRQTGEAFAKRLKVSHDDDAEQQDDFFSLQNGERFDGLERLYTISENVTLDDALALHKYFSCPDIFKTRIQNSRNPGLEIINFLRKRSIITTTNIDELEKASTELKLRNLSNSIEGSTKVSTEQVTSVKVRSSQPLGLLENTLSSFKRNKVLGRFFQRNYGVHYIGAREGCIELLLASTSGNPLAKLRKDLESGELSRKLKEILTEEGDLNTHEEWDLACEEGSTIAVNLQISQTEHYVHTSGKPVSQEETSLTKAKRVESPIYRDMLFEVGENLSSSQVDKLASLAEFSAREKDELNRHEGKKSMYLLHLLEEKGKLSENDVSWLQNNLAEIHNRLATSIVDTYFSGKDKSKIFPNEPEASSSDDNDACNTFQAFLSKIGLQEKFPRKLSLKMFLKIKDIPGNQNYIDLFWQKLTSLDYRAGLPDHSLSEGFSMRDFVFSVLHCSDDFVRQDILEKMSACQLAVPIVLKGIEGVSTTFLLWVLRRITKKWKGPQDTLSIEQPIVSYPALKVSVLRIGDVKVSKSQVLNTMLSYSQGNALHSYFLTEEKDIVKTQFSQGTIECAWFLPMYGNDKEIFNEVIAFFNLRGDCRNYPIQTKFACKSSNLTIAFIATDTRDENVDLIQEIKTNSKNFLFVALKEDESGKRKSPKVHYPKYTDHWLFVRVVQMDVLSKRICDIIVHICGMEDKENYFSLKDLSELASETMHVDECNSICKDAQRRVLNLFESTNTDDIIKFKKECFPLQDIWKELVHIEKERYDTENEKHGTFEHQREHILSQKRSKRELQLQTSLSETMKRYYTMITASKGNASLLHYILGFLQDYVYHVVNENTKEDLNKILELEGVIREGKVTESDHGVSTSGEETLWSDMNELGSTKDARSKMKARAGHTYEDMLTECSKLHKICKAKNLGCEHFIRELGQLYEAFKELKHPPVQTNLDSAEILLLPELAASLVDEMQSLEILDGDTGRVPITWVTSVLDSLTRKLGDPKVLVLSVIGVQSSGKSTFLNSMFGVRFPVRAGRCTRGLFIRFLQMEEKLAQELGCQFLIVVDTEGIRSLDHDDRRFDNELVTLALSIANVTIFNIEGENIGPDMTGILQIAAHALMRMKEVDLECHCRIVQQRVSDLTAGDRNKANTNRIMETLDHATKIAAEEEGLEGRYQYFADVVDLRVDENFQYIPCLWTGGMSPPNHMYSETVGKIKSQLFKDIKEKNIMSDFTLSTFTQRIIDVCKAVKEEDFVFNFQDSVRAVDFNKFCLEHNKWIADMRSNMMLHTNELLDRIDSVLTDEGDEDLDIEELKQNVSSKVEKQKQALIKSVETYITNHERRKTIQRYKKTFLDEINIVMKDVENHATAVLTDEYELRKLRLTKNLEKFKAKWRHRLSYEAKKAAASMDARKVERTHPLYDWEGHFEELWEKWRDIVNSESARNKTRVTRSSLTTVCEKLLLRITRDMAVGSEVRTLMSDEGGLDYHHPGHLSFDCSNYIHTKFVRAWMKHRLLSMENCDENIKNKSEEELIDDEREEAANYVCSIIHSEMEVMIEKQSGKPFDGNIFQLMLQNTLDKLSEKHSNFKPPQSLIAKSLLCIAGGSLEWLEENEYENGNNFSALLEFTEEYAIRSDYNAFLGRSDYAFQAANFVYYYMESLVRKQFNNESKNKTYQLKLLLNAANGGSWKVLHFIAESFSGSFFDLFENLFFVPFESWFSHVMQGQSQKFLDGMRNELADKAKTLVVNLIHIVERCERESSSGTLAEWGSRLASNLDCGFISAVGELFEVNGITTVSENLKLQLGNLLDELTCHTSSTFHQLNLYSANTQSKICPKVCPMCKASCDNSLRGHIDHFSHLHRPRGFNAATYADSNKLVLEDCCSSILNKHSNFKYEERIYLCHQYKDIFPHWDIRPSTDDPGKVFWKWLFVMYNDYMASLYECNPADIPQSWYSITKQEALNSLEEDKRLKMDGSFNLRSGPDHY